MGKLKKSVNFMLLWRLSTAKIVQFCFPKLFDRCAIRNTNYLSRMKYGKVEKVRELDSVMKLVFRKNRTILFSQAVR